MDMVRVPAKHHMLD